MRWLESPDVGGGGGAVTSSYALTSKHAPIFIQRACNIIRCQCRVLFTEIIHHTRRSRYRHCSQNSPISTPRFSHVPWYSPHKREDMLLALGSVRACRVPIVQMVMHDPRKWWPSRIWPKVLPSGYFPEFHLECGMSSRVVNEGGIPKYLAIIGLQRANLVEKRTQKMKSREGLFRAIQDFSRSGE